MAYIKRNKTAYGNNANNADNITYNENGIVTTVRKILDKIRNKIGTTDIDSVGDGTLTGAISTLNSNLESTQPRLIWASKTVTFNENGDVGFEKTDKTIVTAHLNNAYADLSICLIEEKYVLHSNVLVNKSASISYAYYPVKQ